MPLPPDRPDLFVVVRVLEVLRRNPDGLRKTPLQLAAGVNYTVFSRYLERLADRELVTIERDDESTERVRLTPRGAEALRFLVSGIERVVRPADEKPAYRAI
ncbi:MAG: transcriptional regulator [Thermoplasmata archaeon]|nr:transcriptional regulator [Thermoplasmata archaeon]